MDQLPAKKMPEKTAKTNRRAKIAFLAILAVGAICLYFYQRREPELVGWGSDLEAALAEAKASQKPKVLIFFSTSPMGELDKIMVKATLQSSKTLRVLKKLGYPKVHLTTRAHRDLAERYGVQMTPAYVLVDPAGKLLKKRTGRLTYISFCIEFLETPINPPQPPGGT